MILGFSGVRKSSDANGILQVRRGLSGSLGRLQRTVIEDLNKSPVIHTLEKRGIFSRCYQSSNTGAVADAGSLQTLPFTKPTSTFSLLAA